MHAVSCTCAHVGCRYDYSEWVRCYARYLDEQLVVFAKTAFYQVCIILARACYTIRCTAQIRL